MAEAKFTIITDVGGRDAIVEFNLPPICPFCGYNIYPRYLNGFIVNSVAIAVMMCSRCTRFFTKNFGTRDVYDRCIENTDGESFLAPSLSKIFAFSENIENLSGDFVETYNQAEQAEQHGLDKICGMGYRKALEFLIKDYIIRDFFEEDKIEKVKKKHLGLCIDQDVKNDKIKELAKRAVWLGNDEAHYLNYHNEEISYLKTLINVVVHWIDDELTSEKALSEIVKIP